VTPWACRYELVLAIRASFVEHASIQGLLKLMSNVTDFLGFSLLSWGCGERGNDEAQVIMADVFVHSNTRSRGLSHEDPYCARPVNGFCAQKTVATPGHLSDASGMRLTAAVKGVGMGSM